MTPIFENELYAKLFNTLIIAVIFLILYLVTRYFISRKMTNKKRQRTISVRINYFLFGLLAIFFGRIWVEGFIHIFYGLSLVSAGLVITNKESIMNFVGGAIITWRSLFVEGDYIKLGDNSGFVHELGFFYFTILQCSKYSPIHVTGEMIKIPNGLVITNAITNFSSNTNLLEAQQKWIVTSESNIKLATELLQDHAESILTDFYKTDAMYLEKKSKRQTPMHAKNFNLDVNVAVALHQASPAGVELTIYYYCFPKDLAMIEKKLFVEIYNIIRQHEDIALVFAS